MKNIQLRTLFAVLTGAVLLTGCPDDETTPSDTEGTGTGDDDGDTMPPTTMPPTTMPPTTDPTPGTDDTGTPMTDDTGTPMTDDGSSSDDGTPMTDDGSSSGSSSEGGSESSSSGGDTGTMNACADENIGSTVPQTVNGDTTGAGDEFILPCAINGGNSDDYIYEFTAPTAGGYVINTEGSAIDTIIAVYDTCDGSPVACNDDGTGEVLCNGYPCSELVIGLEQDETVLIVVDGWNEFGAITLNIEQAAPPPENGFADCINGGEEVCEDGEICLAAVVPVPVGVCAYNPCADAAGCPDAPATGDAPVACLDVTMTGTPYCVLDCANGETCPDGMACALDVCVFEGPADGGSCCDDSTGGVAGEGTPGCDTPAYEYCVCTQVGDTFCCDTEWDATCVTEAIEECGATCPA
jgi:hypothetical protein